MAVSASKPKQAWPLNPQAINPKALNPKKFDLNP